MKFVNVIQFTSVGLKLAVYGLKWALWWRNMSV